MDEQITIKYKNLEFTVELTDASSSSKNDWTIMSMYTGSSVILEDYSDDVFFDKFVGEEFKKEDLDRWTRKIKRSVGLYMRGKDDKEEVVVEVVSNTPKESDKPAGAIDRIIFDTVERALSSDQSKAGIDTLIKDLIKENGVVPFRKVLEVRKEGAEKGKDAGLQHKDFEKILKTISAGVNVALVGPAGSGKTTIVSNAAKILDMGFASQSVSAQSTTFDFFGYKNAKGDYVSTLFREKYENGGVFLLDEFDAGNPNVLAALNQATANENAPFPDKMVPRHKDFIIIMAGNTFGGGGTIDYVGRNKIDAATLDRFAFIHVQYDEELERSLSTNAYWCNRVQKYREQAHKKKVRTIISPRATLNGERLLAVGIPEADVEEMVIFKGLNADERNLIQLF